MLKNDLNNKLAGFAKALETFDKALLEQGIDPKGGLDAAAKLVEKEPESELKDLGLDLVRRVRAGENISETELVTIFKRVSNAD